MPSQLGDVAQADDVPRLHQPLVQQQHQRRPAGHEMRILAMRSEQLERLGDRTRGVVVERIDHEDYEDGTPTPGLTYG